MNVKSRTIVALTGTMQIRSTTPASSTTASRGWKLKAARGVGLVER